MANVKTQQQDLPGHEMDGKEFVVSVGGGGEKYLAVWSSKQRCFHTQQGPLPADTVVSWASVGNYVDIQRTTENWPTQEGRYVIVDRDGYEATAFCQGGRFWRWRHSTTGVVFGPIDRDIITAWGPIAAPPAPCENCERLTRELAALERIARRAGAWRTLDGKWVSGCDEVYYLSDDDVTSVALLATEITPSGRHYWASTPEAAAEAMKRRNEVTP